MLRFKSAQVTSLVEWHRREEIIGKEVIDSTAKKIGFVRDLAYSADGRLALILENEKAEEVFTHSWLLVF